MAVLDFLIEKHFILMTNKKISRFIFGVALLVSLINSYFIFVFIICLYNYKGKKDIKHDIKHDIKINNDMKIKDILLIAPLNKMKERVQYSNDRFNIFEFLNGKNNITLIDNNTNINYNDYKIIIYYFVTQGIFWHPPTEITHSTSKKLLWMEDYFYTDELINISKKFNFDENIRIGNIPNTELQLISNNIKYSYFGDFFYIDTSIYRNLNIPKEIDILYYGTIIPTFYPLRYKILKCLYYLQKTSNYNIKIIWEYENIFGEELCNLINKSKFCISTSSKNSMPVKKYMEIPLCNSTIIGDIPVLYKDLFTNKVVEIKQSASLSIIYNTLKECCEGKYDSLLPDKYLLNYFKNKYNFDELYNKINKYVDK